MKCPTCTVDLKMSDRQGVEIDYCPQCRGVWLDRGELDKIIERAGPDAPPLRPGSGYSPVDYDDYRYKSRRRKSFLREIFDFD
ncbi:MAG TPA: zf-TFIIB domain-containing protein [Candidatus Eisenbacteria bacterium]|nr:zf-TFIIB domain-containing protein [Candidatus Eisenbacteria bacterium]